MTRSGSSGGDGDVERGAGGEDPKQGPPCERCPALCCRYFALEIDRPVTREDYDRIRWYLLHENTVVWVQDGEWHLEVRNRCRELQSGDRCAAYDTRPGICREYGSDPEDPCEFCYDDLEFDLYFDTPEKLQLHAGKALERRERRLARRRELYRLRKARR